MTRRTFSFRLRSDHPAGAIQAPLPVVERLADTGIWEVQRPDLTTPPFRLYLISLLLCLRYHLVSEAEERQIPFRQLQATLTAVVSEAWDLERITADFQLLLDPMASAVESERADGAALAAMRERMELCPVARNLPASATCALHVGYFNRVAT